MEGASIFVDGGSTKHDYVCEILMWDILRVQEKKVHRETHTLCIYALSFNDFCNCNYVHFWNIYIAELLVLLENMDCAYVKFYYQISCVLYKMFDSWIHSMETKIWHKVLDGSMLFFITRPTTRKLNIIGQLCASFE